MTGDPSGARASVLPRVVVAGHLCLDLTPGLAGGEHVEPGHLFEVGPLSVQLGGSVGNTGRDLVDLGLAVDVVADVGDDALGDLLVRTVTAQERMTPRLRRVQGRTTSYTVVFETADTDRSFWHHVGSNAVFDGSELDGVAEADLVHLGYPSLLPALVADGGGRLRDVLAGQRKRGATTSVDLAVIDPAAPTGALDWTGILRTAMSEVDVVTPSLDDLVSALPAFAGSGDLDDATVERLADTLVDWGAGVVAVTAGPRGVHLRTAGADRLARCGRGLRDPDGWADVREWVRPYPVSHLVTTTGAGDAASAGILVGLLAGAAPDASAHLAMACSAAVVSGGRPTLAAVAALDPGLDLRALRTAYGLGDDHATALADGG